MNKDNLDSLKRFIRASEAQINQLSIVKRVLDRYPFDHIAEETLSKAFALATSVVVLIENRQQDEAFGLTRSVVEAALNLRWISAERHKLTERAFKFINYSKQERQFWYWHAKNSEHITEADAREAELIASKLGLTPQEKVDAHWSGLRGFTYEASVKVIHPTDHIDFLQKNRKVKQDVDYFTTSCFVHCSQPGIDDYFSEDQQFRIRTAMPHPNDRATASIFNCNMYLSDCIRYALYGMNVHVPEDFDCLRRLTFDSKKMEYRFS